MEKGKLQKEGLSNWNTKNYGEVTEREAWERNCKTVCNWNACCFFLTRLFSQKAAEGTRIQKVSHLQQELNLMICRLIMSWFSHQSHRNRSPTSQHLSLSSLWLTDWLFTVCSCQQLKRLTKGKWRDKQLELELHLKWTDERLQKD